MFRQIKVSGSPEQRGEAHGVELADQIAGAIEFYAGVFKLPQTEVFKQARHFRETIRQFEPAYCDEIDAIGFGAGVEPLWIYALNARSEIISLNRLDPLNECTALFFRPTAVLAENWDWAQKLEDLACLIHVEWPDRWIYMLTEPGIIGKIGMNSFGLGVCLNFLTVHKRLDGLPIHILLRALLDAPTLDEARRVVDRAGLGKAGNVLIGDAGGECVDVEFSGDRVDFLQPEADVMLHTNHCLARHVHERADYPSSYARYQTANRETVALDSFAVVDMKRVLSDRSNAALPVYRPYVADEELGAMGTVCTVIMELPQRRFHLRRGNGADTGFAVTFDGFAGADIERTASL